MAQLGNELAVKTAYLPSVSAPTWWKETTDSCWWTSDLHTHNMTHWNLPPKQLSKTLKRELRICYLFEADVEGEGYSLWDIPFSQVVRRWMHSWIEPFLLPNWPPTLHGMALLLYYFSYITCGKVLRDLAPLKIRYNSEKLGQISINCITNTPVFILNSNMSTGWQGPEIDEKDINNNNKPTCVWISYANINTQNFFSPSLS